MILCEPLNAVSDDAAIHQTLANLQEAWAEGDLTLWGDQFSEDADFTVWNGVRLQGRAAIVEGHAGLFRGPYKGTRLRLALDGVSYVRPDVAVVLTQGTMRDSGEPETKQTFVLAKQGSTWRIEAFQNTKILR